MMTGKDIAALRLLRDEQVLRRGDRRARGSTLGRLVTKGFALLIGAEASDDRVARFVITSDGEDHLAAREGRGPSCWRLTVNGVPACCSPLTERLPVGCGSSRRSELRRWAETVKRRFPQALVAVVPGTCDPNTLDEEAR